MSSSPPARTWIGITLALAAAFAFALANTSASLAYHSGSNPLSVAAIRFVLPAAVLVVWLRLQGVPLSLSTRDGWIAATLGAVTAVYSWALLSAIGAIPLALAVLVFYLFPLIATVILGLSGWEKLGWKRSRLFCLLSSALHSRLTCVAAISISQVWHWHSWPRLGSVSSLSSPAASSAQAIRDQSLFIWQPSLASC